MARRDHRRSRLRRTSRAEGLAIGADAIPEDAIMLFTANPYVIDAKGRMTPHALKDRFLARVRRLDFPEPTIEELAAFLERVWKTETNRGRTGGKQGKPEFHAIARAARGNIRSGSDDASKPKFWCLALSSSRHPKHRRYRASNAFAQRTRRHQTPRSSDVSRRHTVGYNRI